MTLKEKLARSSQITHLKNEIATRELAIKSMPNFADYHLMKIAQHEVDLLKLEAI